MEIFISRISQVQAQFVKYKYFTSIRKIWSTAAIREIKILEMETKGPFVKYTALENNHLYGSKFGTCEHTLFAGMCLRVS